MIQKIKNIFHEFNIKRELQKNLTPINIETRNFNADQLVDFIYEGKYQRFFWIKQVKTEILRLCKIVEKRKPRVILEIGTANGGSLFLFSKLADPNALIISIDLPGGEFGGGYPAYKESFYKSFAMPTQRIELLRADSHSIDTFNKLKTILNEEKIDFLFIDGDHTYSGVKTDFELYSPLVSETGMIAFHDIAIHPPEWGVDVYKYWDEIKSGFTSHEFIENKSQGWAGIGVIEKTN